MNARDDYDRALVLATGAHAEDPEFGELAAVTQDFATALHVFAEQLYQPEADICSISNRMNALSGEIDQYSQWLRDQARAEKAETAT